jgi:hypothetical protein
MLIITVIQWLVSGIVQDLSLSSAIRLWNACSTFTLLSVKFSTAAKKEQVLPTQTALVLNPKELWNSGQIT